MKDAFELGRSFAPKVDVDLWVDARGIHKGGISIGEEYYETDPWSKKEDAVNELKGCWARIKEKGKTQGLQVFQVVLWCTKVRETLWYV